MFNNSNLLFLLPEVNILVYIFFFVSFFTLWESKYDFKENFSTLCANLSILSLIQILLFLNYDFKIGYFLNYNYIIDNFSIFMKIIIIFITLILIIFSYNYVKLEKMIYYEYYLFILFSCFANMVLASAIDLFTIYLIIELQGLCFYVLATFKTYSNFSTEAGVKYFIQGAVASGILLLGFSIIYGATGTTNLIDIKLLFSEVNNSDVIYNVYIFYLGLCLVIISLLFKLAVAPFHMWAPDVYEGVPTSVTFIFATLPKIGFLALFIRSLISFSEYIYFFNFILLICGILSIVIGTMGALYQIKLKRWLVFASLPHIGFIIIIMSMNKVMSISILLFYLLIYILITINVFIVVLILRRHNNNLKIISINEFLFVLKSNKMIAVAFVPLLLSVVGIPPFIGFFNKFTVLYWVMGAEMKVVLSMILIIFSVISGLYYIRLIKKIIFIKNSNIKGFLKKLDNTQSVFLSGLFFFNLFLFFYIDEILIITTNIALSLYNY